MCKGILIMCSREIDLSHFISLGTLAGCMHNPVNMDFKRELSRSQGSLGFRFLKQGITTAKGLVSI